MKVIDLLNKIANGEEVPKKIKYDNDIWNYDEIEKDYILIDKSGELSLICEELNLMFALNEEVEIIEEDKKIETLDLDWVEVLDFKEQAQQDCVKMVLNKINEIIDYLEEKE